MKNYFADNIKAYRIEKEISQEKLAQYLGVSPQAVSKWERAVAYPDITLLPELARYFGVTVDELLGVEKTDERRLYEDAYARAGACFRAGDKAGVVAVWQEVHRQIPNHLGVMEKLMSAYFDMDKRGYQGQITELGCALYHADYENAEDGAFLRGQAVELMARTYAAAGDMKQAEAWATKASYLMHAQEFIMMEITQGKDLLSYFRFANDWYFKNLFYMALQVVGDAELADHAESLLDTVIALYEAVYPQGDMSYEMHERLCDLYCRVAVYAARRGDAERTRGRLTQAVQCATNAGQVTAHVLSHPLVRGLPVEDAPENAERLLTHVKGALAKSVFDAYRAETWFSELTE